MQKPKFLLMSKYGWAATSPLIYTLQRKSKYAHFGYTKGFRYFCKATKFVDCPQCPELSKRVLSNTWENWNIGKMGSHNMNTTEDLEPLRDFSTNHFKTLISGRPTIDKYVTFYTALYEHVITKGYKSVGSGWTYHLSPYIRRFYKTLRSEFEFKQIKIVRDPVRRAFGQFLGKCPKTMDFPDHFNPPSYIERMKEDNELWGEERNHTVVMEELWEGDGTAKKELSEFLDHPITDLYKNLYSPDRGHLVEYDKDVPCQVMGQNLFELTPELYYKAKEKFQHVYDEWENYYGSLPLYWGVPLDYKTGKPI
tara:strand:- start:1280 stop:2206 length:927 start_codon:yes stop_codon:yes gene_type:complete